MSLPQNLKKILLIQYGSIGDTLLTTAAVRAVRERFPKSFIAYVIEPLSYPIMEHNPCLDKVFKKPWDLQLPLTYPVKYLLQWSFLRELRSHRFDLVLDLESTYRTSYLALLCGAKFRAGFSLHGRRSYLNSLYQIRIAREAMPTYRRDRYRGFLEQLGIAAPFQDLEFHAEPAAKQKTLDFFRQYSLSSRKKVVGVNPCGPRGSEWKCWPSRKFAALCDLLQDQGHQVVLIAAPGEAAYVRMCREQTRAATALPLMEVQSLSEFAWFLDRLSLLVTIDSGAKHLAVARKTPTLTFFGGKNDIKQWHPLDMPRHRMLYAHAIGDIQVLDALTEADALLKKEWIRA